MSQFDQPTRVEAEADAAIDRLWTETRQRALKRGLSIPAAERAADTACRHALQLTEDD